MTLSDETVTQVTPGIIATDDGYQCLQCGNTDKRYMYEYETPFSEERIIYCRYCIQLGRMDNITEFKITQSENTISEGHYDLLFQLSEQQQYASEQELYKQLKRFTHYYYMRLLVRVRLK